ncbi:MAG: hypothetical protein ABW039_09030 [Sphingobium sp.]
MSATGFFARDGALYVPLEPTHGYWKHDSLHGRAIVGLIGYEMERVHGADGLVPVRYNVDMHKLARFAPVAIETRVIRDSARLRLVEAVMLLDGVEHARAQCQFLRAAEAPPGRVWAPAPWDAPPPDALTPLPVGKLPRLFDWIPISGKLGHYAPRQMWMREHYDLVEGEPLTPWSRVTLAADFASPWTHGGDAGIRYINTDVVVQVHRMPVGEWIGFEASGHEASQAIAVGQCRIYDVEGPLGYVFCTALANERRA